MYSIPQEINKNKIFIVNRSEIAGRWDPHYNKPEYSELYSTLKKRPFVLSHLREESYSIFSGITPKSGGDAYSEGEDSIPFVRSGDFSETNQIDFSSLLYLKPEIHYGIMSSSQLKRNDLLVAIVGATIGKIGVYTYEREANINQAICGVRLKEHLSPFYVQAFYQTEIGQKIIERIKRPVARANLNLEEIGNLPIPIIDLQNQLMVINILQKGINNKLQKESEAQKLLESIDDYLLGELEIKLPVPKDGLNYRMYYVSYNELLGKRIDSKKYAPYIKQLFASIKQSSYPRFPLEHYIIESYSGEWGKDCDRDEVPNGYVKCLTLRATEIDNKYNLNIQPDKVKYRLISEEKYNNIKLEQGDIIIEKSGGSEDQPVGRVAIIEDDVYNSTPLSFSNFLMKIRVKGISPEYLYFFLKTMYNIGITDSMQSQTNGIRNLIVKEFLEQTIIEPSSEKQQKIVEHISSIRQQAKRLQEEGKAILKNAKNDVERMIIGE